MTDEVQQWEYRVETIGSVFGTKDEQIQGTLDEWGSDGWEAINVYTPYGSGKITIVAKRLLTERVRRLRSMPPT
ncbi:MAG TPA: hypothetical protein VN653_15820 [Anaerolineales bacterium]|nr:hypothetical protein [Anaerolineales bacterium]